MAPAVAQAAAAISRPAVERVGRTMTTEGDSGSEPQGEFKPIGTVAFVAAFVVVLMLMWFSIYIILLSRGATL